MEVLQKIYDVIAERAKNPQEGSYTNHLLGKGLDKICKKVGEEASETIIAAKNKNSTELTGEVADLLYHLLVLLYTQGVSLAEINAELEKRFLKGGFHGHTK